jgi:hypothetical protein
LTFGVSSNQAAAKLLVVTANNVRFVDHHGLGDWLFKAIAAPAKAVTRIAHAGPKFQGRPIDLPPEG